MQQRLHRRQTMHRGPPGLPLEALQSADRALTASPSEQLAQCSAPGDRRGT
jgi:hypothetical protein